MNLRLRLLLLVGILLTAVLGASLGLVHRDLSRQIHESARATLAAAQAHFQLLEERRREALEIAATALEQEPGFRNVLRTHDQPTMLDYLRNVLEAYRLDLVLVTDQDGRVLVSTPPVLVPPEGLAPALQGVAGVDYWLLDKILYQVAFLPMGGAGDRMAGALTVGALLDDRFTARLARDSGCQVLLRHSPDEPTLSPTQGVSLSLALGTAARLVLIKDTRDAGARVARLTTWLVGLGLGALTVALLLSYPMLGRISDPVEALARAEARLQAVVEANTDGLLALDPQGRVASANPAAGRALGQELEQLIGAPIEALLDSDTADRLLADPEGRLSQSAVYERERRRFSLTRTFLGRDSPGSLIVFRDITQERAWELRTGVFFELLAQTLHNRGPELPRNLDNLTVLAGGQRAEPTSVDLSALGLSPLEGTPERVVAHPASLRLVLENLLHNASRFGKNAQLGARRDGGAIEIWVSDEGLGFDETRAHEITDATYPKRSLHKDPSKESGLGIGLVVCRTLLLEMGSNLRYQPLTPGSRFSFWLPQAPS